MNKNLINEFEEQRKKANKKIKRYQNLDPSVSIEDFGFNNNNLVRGRKNTEEQIRDKIKNLKDFNSSKFYMKKIGTTLEYGKTINVYMSNVSYDWAVKDITELNRRRLKTRDAVTEVGRYYKKLNPTTGQLEERKRTKEELKRIFDTNPDFQTTSYKIKGGKTVGSVHNRSRKYAINPENFRKMYSEKFRQNLLGKKNQSYHQMNVNLMNNFLKGIENGVSKNFARNLKNLFKELKIDAEDFIALYYTTGVFDFDFIYDESNIGKKEIRERIRSELESFRADNEKYRKFRQIIEE